MKLLTAAVAAMATLCPAQTTTTDVSWGLFPFLVGNQDGQINAIVANAVANGVDTLYVSAFRTRSSQNGELWITDRAGWNPAWGAVRPGGAGIDLRALITAAHAQHIRVVPVIKCFDSSVQPTDAAHRQYLLDVIDWLVHSYDSSGRPIYDVDGVALDYIRFVGSTAGSNYTLVTNFVGQIKQLVGVLSVHAYLIANRYTFDGPTYDLNFNSYSSAMSILRRDFGQDWQGLATHLDVLMPMCYTSDGSIYNQWHQHWGYVRQAALYANQALVNAGQTTKRVAPVVATYDLGSGSTTTAQTIDASIAGALAGGADGYQSFRYGTMRNNASWMAAFHAYAAPNQNWPLARLDVSVAGLTATLDTTGSCDRDQPSSSLLVRLDLDDDGIPDTPWQAPSASTQLQLTTALGGRVGMQVRDHQGQITATKRHVRGANVLAASPPFYSASASLPLNLYIDAGPAAAGSLYLTLVSLSGSSPGFMWNGLNVPINYDGLTDGLLGAVNTPILANGLGTTDAQGRATATFWVPSGLLAPIALQTMTWCAIAVDPATNAPRFVSNAVPTIILN